MNPVKIKSFCTSLATVLAAVAVSVVYPLSLWQTLFVAAISAMGIFFSLENRRCLKIALMFSATAGCLVCGVRLAQLSAPGVAFWQWMLGWLLLVGLLCYFGKKAMNEAGILVGLTGAVCFLLFFFAVLPTYQGSVSFGRGSILDTIWVAIVLQGCVITAKTLCEHQPAAKWGALTAVCIWFVCSILPFLVWSNGALRELSYPLRSAWQRGELFLLIFCPDILLCSLGAVLCLWQNAAALYSLKK